MRLTGRVHRCLGILGLAAALLPPAAGRGQERPVAPTPLRVLALVTDDAATEAAAGRDRNAFADGLRASKLFETRRVRGVAAPDDLAWADLLLLERAALSGDPERLEASLEVVLAAVNEGQGLVIAGEAPALAPGSRSLSLLAGRRAVSPAARETTRLAVLVDDQRHPITQCVTHFLQCGRVADIDLATGARVLARAREATATDGSAGDAAARPIAWTVQRRRGRVFVTTLDRCSGPSSKLVMALVERAAQWVARRPISVPLPAECLLLAETLDTREAASSAGGVYRGRRIAPVMSYHGADWLMRRERDVTEQPDKVLDSLKISPGQTVVDMGVGAGYFALRLARRVGPGGKVLGVDIQPEMLDLLKANAVREGLTNIVPVLATATDPRLPESTVDLVLMVDVYHELSRPAAVMEAIRVGLKPSGRVVLVEYRGEDPAVPIKPLHRMTVRQARAELEASGFRFVENKTFLPHQHVLIFQKAEVTEER